MLSLKERIAGGIWGLLIGDALGVPYEFNTPQNLPSIDRLEFNPPPQFVRSHQGILPGTWSDDGAQALCLLDSLIYCGTLDIDDLAKRLLKWYQDGLWALDNNVFDVGNQTRISLNAYKNGKSPMESGFSNPEGKGNGSLMRVLPLVLWHNGEDEELVDFAHKQSVITHGHICNQVCCALYCVWAKRLMEGHSLDASYKLAVGKLRQIYKEGSQYRFELEETIRPDESTIGKGSGYVADCLWSVRMVLNKGMSYEQVVKQAVALGDDTDTTAAVAGGLAGIYFGINDIPTRWFSELRGREQVMSLLHKLIDSKDASA